MLIASIVTLFIIVFIEFCATFASLLKTLFMIQYYKCVPIYSLCASHFIFIPSFFIICIFYGFYINSFDQFELLCGSFVLLLFYISEYFLLFYFHPASSRWDLAFWGHFSFLPITFVYLSLFWSNSPTKIFWEMLKRSQKGLEGLVGRGFGRECECGHGYENLSIDMLPRQQKDGSDELDNIYASIGVFGEEFYL